MLRVSAIPASSSFAGRRNQASRLSGPGAFQASTIHITAGLIGPPTDFASSLGRQLLDRGGAAACPRDWCSCDGATDATSSPMTQWETSANSQPESSRMNPSSHDRTCATSTISRSPLQMSRLFQLLIAHSFESQLMHASHVSVSRREKTWKKTIITRTSFAGCGST